MGYILRDLFPEPDSILFLMGINQKQFMEELNTLILEARVGMESDTTVLVSAVL